MRKKLSFILCIALMLCMIPTTSAFAAKKVKSKSVSVAPKSMTLIVGDVAQLNATMKPVKSTDKLTWTSSNKAVATVTKNGMVQGVSAGTATITVKTSSKKKAKCTVIVKDFMDENALREKIREELKAEFATKNDIQTLISQNTYTKREIDEKISAITPNGSSASCNCEIKTNNDVVNVIKQNTYTKREMDSKMAVISTDGFASKDDLQALSQGTYSKSEIDSIIAAIPTGGAGSVDWEDGAELPLLSCQSLPLAIGDITIESVTIKKYHNEAANSGNDYRPFKLSISIAGTFSGTEESLRSTYICLTMYNGDCALYGFGTGIESAIENGGTAEISGKHFAISVDDNYQGVGDRFIICGTDYWGD